MGTKITDLIHTAGSVLWVLGLAVMLLSLGFCGIGCMGGGNDPYGFGPPLAYLAWDTGTLGMIIGTPMTIIGFIVKNIFPASSYRG